MGDLFQRRGWGAIDSAQGNCAVFLLNWLGALAGDYTHFHDKNEQLLSWSVGLGMEELLWEESGCQIKTGCISSHRRYFTFTSSWDQRWCQSWGRQGLPSSQNQKYILAKSYCPCRNKIWTCIVPPHSPTLLSKHRRGSCMFQEGTLHEQSLQERQRKSPVRGRGSWTLDLVGPAEWILQTQSTPCASACLQVIFCEVVFKGNGK